MASQIDKYISLIKEKVIGYFPKTEAIIVWGGSLRPDFSIESGDIDLIIVDNQDLTGVLKIQKKLNYLENEVKGKFELDPTLTNKDNLKKLFVITSFGTRYLHGIDRFLIKNNSKIIFGNVKILELIPKITIEDAIKDVVPHVRDVFIAQIFKDIEKISDISEYVAREKSKFAVIIRTLFTIENKKTGSKKEVLNYLKEKYPNLQQLAEFLLELYTTGKTDKKIVKKQVIELLNLSKKKMESLL